MNKTTQRKWAERAIEAVAKDFPQEPQNPDNWAECEQMLGCALECSEHTKLYEIQTEVAASLLDQSSLYLRTQAKYPQAFLLCQEALKIREQVLGKQHPGYASSLNNLAELYREQGQYEQALLWYQEALKIVEQVLGKHHPDYAESLNNLAVLYNWQGQYDQALSLYQ